MNKIINQHALRQVRLFKKIVRIMRLTIACLLIACLQVSASGYSQDNITLNLKSVELRKAFIAIEKKTDYRFLFNETLIAHKPKIDIQVTERPVTEKRRINYCKIQGSLIKY